jgi:hypothetical protein
MGHLRLRLTRSARIGMAVLLAILCIVGMSSSASARHAKHHVRVADRAEQISAWRVEPASQQSARLGPMRYYGGPKSPMWRAPVEN